MPDGDKGKLPTVDCGSTGMLRWRLSSRWRQDSNLQQQLNIQGRRTDQTVTLAALPQGIL